MKRFSFWKGRGKDIRERSGPFVVSICGGGIHIDPCNSCLDSNRWMRDSAEGRLVLERDSACRESTRIHHDHVRDWVHFRQH